MLKKITHTLLALMPLAALQIGCSSSDSILGTGDLVTVSGFVNNIDTLVPAGNVKVYLYGHESDYNTTTADDGSFSIKIPVGTRFILVTDDEDGATKDNWFKTANFEIYKPVVDQGFENYFIHACPSLNSDEGVNSLIVEDDYANFFLPGSGDTPDTETSTAKGSVAVWKEFLANTAAADALFPDVNTVSDASGIVSMSILQYPDAAGLLGYANASKIRVTTDSEDDFGPIVYTNGNEFFFADNTTKTGCNLGSDATCICDAAYPGKIAVADAESNGGIICGQPDEPYGCSATESNSLSLIWSFGKPSFTGKSVTLSFTNTDVSGDRKVTNLPDDLEVFVEPNMISLILWGLYDENEDGNYEGVALGEILGPIFGHLTDETNAPVCNF